MCALLLIILAHFFCDWATLYFLILELYPLVLKSGGQEDDVSGEVEKVGRLNKGGPDVGWRQLLKTSRMLHVGAHKSHTRTRKGSVPIHSIVCTSMAPFPYMPMLAIMASLVSYLAVQMSIFSYVGFMMEYLGVVDDTDKAGETRLHVFVCCVCHAIQMR